jgi:hypothetical protein
LTRKHRFWPRRATQARAGWWLGWLTVCAGVFLAFGLAVALMVAGLVTALTFLWLHDVDDDQGEEVRRR